MTTPENAVYADWARHLGKPSKDPELIAEFQAAGVAKVPYLKRGDVMESADIGSLTVNMMDPEFLGLRDLKLKRGEGILGGITIHLGAFGANAYAGPLPYSVAADDSRTSLRKKLGEPNEANERRRYDTWRIDGLRVVASYSEDFEQLMSLRVSVPDEE